MANDENLQGKATDFIKKMLTVGVSTIFLTEESIRTMVQELKLPTEFLSGVLKSAQDTKNQFLKSLSQEVMSRVGDKVDPRAFIDEILTRYEIEMNVKFNFKKKGEDSKIEL